MDDDSARTLLRLLYAYVLEYGPDTPKTVSGLAEDLAMSLKETSNVDDEMRRYIEISLA